jgi:5'-methylthioadenosine phosphorylase
VALDADLRWGVALADITCDFAVIGGTGLYDPELLEAPRQASVATPYGVVDLYVGSHAGRRIAFLPRHGAGHSLPPHRVNYRGNIWALRQLGVGAVLATSACGSLAPELAPGSLALLDQFLDFTHGRRSTFFDGGDTGVRHTDMTAPYCPELRQALGAAAAAAGIPLCPAATYVCTEGPRFETPAEIRAFRQLGGDLVGMTGVPEVVLAREAGLCYAGIAIATNYAAGLAGRPLSHDEVVAAMAAATGAVRRLLLAAVASLPAGWACRSCPAAPGPLP